MDPRLAEADALMDAFAERTGLSGPERPGHRYLWTDAFAVCNYLWLGRATGASRPTELARRLIDVVHRELARHRPDDPRRGWISGLGEEAGAAHPTAGGLRIGKELPERPAGEPLDPPLEWDRDGQYFHYLTQWMHALDQTARVTGEMRFNLWARELAVAAHAGFVRGGRMVWKASIDLSRPLVESMGQHDPLGGLVACAQLQATARTLPDAPPEPTLQRELADFAALAWPASLDSDDPLGLGGLLTDAARLAQLGPTGAFDRNDLLAALLGAAADGVRSFAAYDEPRQPPAWRLPFRELGLAIGLSSLAVTERALGPAAPAAVTAPLRALSSFVPLGDAIRSSWLAPAGRSAATWSEHLDINTVMLATALMPAGYTELAPRAA